MSQEAMGRLDEIVRAVVIGPEGVPGSAMTVLAAELRTRPKLLLDALKELSDLGSQSRPRAPDAADAMCVVVNEVLLAWGFRHQWAGLVLVARGIIDLMTREGRSR